MSAARNRAKKKQDPEAYRAMKRYNRDAKTRSRAGEAKPRARQWNKREYAHNRGESGGGAEEDEEPEPEPEPLVEGFDDGRIEFHGVLKDIELSPEEFWMAFKRLVCGTMYNDLTARAAYQESAVGVASNRLFNHGWDWDTYDLRISARDDILPGLEAYVWREHGWRWTRLTNLIESFDNMSELEKEKGFGQHVLGDAKTQEKNEACVARFVERLAPPRRSGRLRG